MNSFIHDDFLLTSPAAVRLYHDYAQHQPIIDYHNHLSPADIATDRRFENIGELWLAHDHYKWRAMRANGIDERFCTGNASAKEKFFAFARTVPATLRNPIYHWTHLELKRFFGLDVLLDESTAELVWNECNRQLVERADLSVQSILKAFHVKVLCTTDDPVDDLEHHLALAASPSCVAAVYPTFRPDSSIAVDQPDLYRRWIEQLEQATSISIRTLDDLLNALSQRHNAFHQLGCRLSDHGLESIPTQYCDEQTANSIFINALSGRAASAEEHAQFTTFLLLFFARLDAQKGWTKQLHLGVWRNNNSRLFQLAGRDIGCDSIADTHLGQGLSHFLDTLDRENALPKMVVYNLNSRDNYLVSTLSLIHI
jgi:glucuronate isomerase